MASLDSYTSLNSDIDTKSFMCVFYTTSWNKVDFKISHILFTLWNARHLNRHRLSVYFSPIFTVLSISTKHDKAHKYCDNSILPGLTEKFDRVSIKRMIVSTCT